MFYENHQNNCIQYKTTKTTFPKKSKAVFISIRYRKTSQTQDVKSQSTERSVRKLARPERDSEFEQKHVLFQVERSEEVLKTIFFSYNQRKKQSSAQKDVFGTYVFLGFLCFAFGQIAQCFSEGLCENHQNSCIPYKTTKTTFPKKTKAVFVSIRCRKTSQTQDVESQSTERSVRKLAQPKRDSAFEQETRIVSSGEI